MSSMLTGERKWSSARRGGMTSLGKVAVPKPINLPSQRLENHGLDPNVEIVPKGTYSWGTKSSSSASNAWGASTTSPNNDGGTGSPSFHNVRPSSGSGTRPSTAGSDRANEPIANAWGSNSRPSSASGSLTSSQASPASLRPRSAETRPRSSQLSRFAESSDSSVAWGATGMAEKLGVTSSKNNEFSLASGDFPTLGSEKETSDNGSHGHPCPSSGGVAYLKETTENSEGDITGNSNVKSGTASSWRRENTMYGEDGARPPVEKWHADPHIYPNSSLPPQQYDAWHGPPLNSHPGGVWYRGPMTGPPFGSPVGPGGFPMEPFPYYRPQIPPTALANPPSVPPPLAGPRGPHPKNGDMYRPRMPDDYIRPGMQIRPGFYPGPVPYESYYGPPMGYCNSNERDIPFIGMPMGPTAYHRYSGQNAPDPSNSHGRTGGYGPNGKGVVARVPYNGLLKQHDGWEGEDEQKCDDNVTAAAPYPGKGDQPRKSSWDNGGRTDHKKDEELSTRRTALGEEAYKETVNNGSRDFVKAKPETMGYLKASDDRSVKRLDQVERAVSGFPEVSPAPRDPNLIQKIEGLNAKARASEGRQDVQSVSTRDEQKNKLQVIDVKANQAYVTSTSHEDFVSAGNKIPESTVTGGTTSSRRSTHGIHGKADDRSRGRLRTHETDSWRKKSQIPDSPVAVLPNVHVESSVHGLDSTVEATKKSGSNSCGKDDEESVPHKSDPSDDQLQHAKMRDLELAKQRLKKEEEERARDQKAKARVKLEELNRRTQGEVLSQKIEPKSNIQNKQEEFSTLSQPNVVPGKPMSPSSTLGSVLNSVAKSSESSSSRSEISTGFSSKVLQETQKTTSNESVMIHDESEIIQQNVNNSESIHSVSDRHFHESRTSKQKRTGYRQKQNSPLEKNYTEMLTLSSTTESSKGDIDVVASAIVSLEGVAYDVASNSESRLPVNSGVVPESAIRRKNRTVKNKLKVEETSSAAALSSMVSEDSTASDITAESNKAKIPEPVLNHSSVQSLSASKDTSSERSPLVSNEEAHARVNNQWKSQHPRRTQRNLHANKPTEKVQTSDAVVWAPVRSQNKIDISDEASERTVEAINPTIKNDQQVVNNPRNKRAEMERYIPRLAAKEMAQRGSSQQSVSVSSNQIASDEAGGKFEHRSVGVESSQTFGLVFGKIECAMESRNGDGSQNKLVKVHGARRQTATLNPSSNTQKPIEHPQPHKSDGSSVKEQSRHADEWSASNSWNIPENPNAPVPVPAVKDQAVTAKGKRQPYKGHKGAGYNNDPDDKRVDCGDTEIHQSELPAGSKENGPVVDRSVSQWQPKSNSFLASNERGSRSNHDQNVGVEVGREHKKDSVPQGGVPLPQPDKESDVTVVKGQHHHDPSLSEKSFSDEAQIVGNQDAKRGRKMTLQKGHPGSPVDPSSNMDAQHERGSSGFRKNGNHNSRFGREHEYRGDWSGTGKGNRLHNAPAQRERQRHGSHFEYQPVAPHNINKTDNSEPPKDASHNSDARFREKGQIHPRRGGGNFNGRQTGNVRLDASYN